MKNGSTVAFRKRGIFDMPTGAVERGKVVAVCAKSVCVHVGDRFESVDREDILTDEAAQAIEDLNDTLTVRAAAESRKPMPMPEVRALAKAIREARKDA